MMTLILIAGIIVSLIIFSFVIIIHEFGHFKTARKFGIKVEEFGLGIPPRAKKIYTDKKGTIYSLNWLPFGGFVRLKGENLNTFNIYSLDGKLLNNNQIEEELKNSGKLYYKDKSLIGEEDIKELKSLLEENKSSNSFINKPAWQQGIVLLAGVFMNFLLAILIFTGLFFYGVEPVGINSIAQTNTELKLIPSPEKAALMNFIVKKPGVYMIPLNDDEKDKKENNLFIAKNAGIKDYDLATKIGEVIINSDKDFINALGNNKNKEVVITLKRALNGCDILKNNKCILEEKTITVTPNSDGKIGAYIFQNQEKNENIKPIKYGIIDSFKYGVIETYGNIELTLRVLPKIVKKIVAPENPKEREEALKQVSGPVGIVHFMTLTIGNGIIFILIITAMISLSLGIFNLLPIPALDGGRFFFVVINGIVKSIFGKKAISERFEGFIHVLFFLILIGLIILITYNDIINIINT